MTGVLAGRRVLVTRERPGELAAMLEALGADVIHVPLIRVVDRAKGVQRVVVTRSTLDCDAALSDGGDEGGDVEPLGDAVGPQGPGHRVAKASVASGHRRTL